MRLLEQLRQQDQQRPLLWVAGQPLSVAELIHQAEALRQRWPELRGARVALARSEPLQQLLALLATDGWAAELLLLAPDLLAQPELWRPASDWLWQDDAPQLLAAPHAAAAPADGSSWTLFTSGTTGTPKAIRYDLARLAAAISPLPDGKQPLRWALMYDLNRFAGVQLLLQCLLGGNQLALPAATSFDAQWQSARDAGVTAISATPSCWRRLLMDERLNQLPLRQLTLGGETADQGLLNRLRQQFPGASICHIYASTEAGVGFAVHDGLAGFPSSWLAGDGPLPLRVDEAGMLWVKSPRAGSNAQLVARQIDGWLPTDDEVVVSGERVLFAGRVGGVINVGGSKIRPESVEAVIRELPWVVDVQVAGKASPLLGQLVTAQVLAPAAPADAKSQLLAHCRSRLPAHGVPALIRFVDSLALTATGKLKRTGER